MKCDRCDNQATVHLIEIKEGQKIEKHLCEGCAVDEGVAVKVQSAPINELLEKFVLKHSGGPSESDSAPSPLGCDQCGMSYDDFRRNGLLGCPNCYLAFEVALAPLLERAHEGADQHLGKVPTRAGVDEIRQQRLLQLRRDLANAVASEEYEKAAHLRDQLTQTEADNK
jgi:protein arginine kinase activator